ncbi:MAG: n-acetylglutamate synthase [Bacteroidia bacterium]
MKFDLNHRKFKSLLNSDNGEVHDGTIFHYRQESKLIWAEYQGGKIQKGFLVGQVIGDYLEFTYQHLNADFELMTGVCKSFPELSEGGKIKLNEDWKWTCKDFSAGKSILIEI